MPEDLGDGSELWEGFHQRFVMGWKPYINVDGNYNYQVFLSSYQVINLLIMNYLNVIVY